METILTLTFAIDHLEALCAHALVNTLVAVTFLRVLIAAIRALVGDAPLTPIVYAGIFNLTPLLVASFAKLKHCQGQSL